MAQPPGSETRALPKRPSSGPSTSTEARMVLTRSYGASWCATPGIEFYGELVGKADLGAHLGQQLDGGCHIFQMRNVFQPTRLVGQQAGHQNRQHGVLGARYGDRAAQRNAALDFNARHYSEAACSSGVRRESVSAWISRPSDGPIASCTWRWRATRLSPSKPALTTFAVKCTLSSLETLISACGNAARSCCSIRSLSIFTKGSCLKAGQCFDPGSVLGAGHPDAAQGSDSFGPTF